MPSSFLESTDLGCAVGRSSFELARWCRQVRGLDQSHRFIAAARTLAARGWPAYARVDEGTLTTPLVARVPHEVDRSRVQFARGDALHLPAGLGRFDVVLLANVLDRLRDPQRCVQSLRDLLVPGGQLIITSPYTWLTAFTPRDRWLGGVRRNGRDIRTVDALHALLDPDFVLREVTDLPFLIREHARKYQWSVAQATCWRRH